MVFDPCNSGYDFQKAHNAGVMDVIAIDFGRKKSPNVTRLSDPNKNEVNRSVAHSHRVNGFEGQPPFFGGSSRWEGARGPQSSTVSNRNPYLDKIIQR